MAILKDTALKIGSVGDCSLPFFYYMLWVCLNKGNSGMLEELSDRTDRIPLNWFSPEASCFLLEGDQLAGMFLVGVGENLELVPALLYVQGDSYRQKVSALMSFAGKKLCEEYDGDTDVVLYAGDEVSKIFAQSMGIR